MTQPLLTVRQLAYVVDDIEAAMNFWINEFNVGPFYLMEHCTLGEPFYKGKPSDVDIHLALANSGDLQVELIEQVNDSPSMYKEFIDAGRKGVHHFGLMADDYAKTCQRYRDQGYEAVFECTVDGAPLTYFDMVDSVGHYLEIWDNNEVFKELFMLVEDAAKGWDGSDPIRQAP